ncbi:MAG: HlyD family efflux transporter periplasmic adaptor subunit [bacterium]|nr:HlyD family efflux transporter periplasmic adaptor subunit [bacterium]
MKKRLLIAVVGVVLLLGGWWAVGAVQGSSEGEWIKVERDDMTLGVELEGTLRAVETSQISAPQIQQVWEFKIAFMATEGAEVEEGTPLLAFDTAELQKQLLRQQAGRDQARKEIEKTEKSLTLTRGQDRLRLAEARANLRRAELKVDAPVELSAEKDAEHARLDLKLARDEVAYLEKRVESAERSAEAALAALRNQRDRADRRVAEINEAVAQMRVAAPRKGTVIYSQGWRGGEKKKVGDACWRGEPVMEVPNLQRMKVDGMVDEADAGRVEEGQRVTFRLDAHPDVEFEGTVLSIWKTVQRKSNNRPGKIVRLEIDIAETDTRKMRPGMRVRGKVEIEQVPETALLPIESVFLKDDGPVVYKKTLMGHRAVPVELGRRDDRRVEVISGVAPGDRVSLIDLAAGGTGS